MEKIHKFKPAVTKRVLLFLAGIMWLFVGCMMLTLAFLWLSKFTQNTILLHSIFGIIIALIIHHFGFLRIVNKNLKRLLPIDDKKCIFSFMPWKSYLIIIIMIVMGKTLRSYSIIPKNYLAILYISIGLALILSSIRYFRFLVYEFKNH
jgi:hypothetical protein